MTDFSTRPQILAVDGLTIRFGNFTALDGVTLDLRAGERMALLGHNGAGKSTLFKTVLGFLKPTSGSVTVAGALPGSDAARRAVSYLPEAVGFPNALTGAEVLTYLARLKGEAPRSALTLLETVGIAHAANRPVRAYSKGMRQRLGLAQALIGKPKLLLLDEPTSGLDPASRRTFYEIIAQVSCQGTAVLLSSHSLTEVEAKTDRVAILSLGKLAAMGPLADLARRAGLPARLRIETRFGEADAIHARIGGARVNERIVVLSCPAEEKLAMLARVAELGDLVTDIDIALPGLDDVYKHFSGEKAEGASS